MGQVASAPPAPSIAHPAAQLLARPDEQHLMTQREAEKPDRGENEDHTGEMHVRLKEDGDSRPDITAGAYGRAGRQSWSEPVDEACTCEEGDHETNCRPEAVGHRSSSDQEDVDDSQPQQKQPRAPAETDEEDVGAERTDRAAGVGRRVIERVSAPAGGIGRVVPAQAQPEEHDREGEGNKGC